MGGKLKTGASERLGAFYATPASVGPAAVESVFMHGQESQQAVTAPFYLVEALSTCGLLDHGNTHHSRPRPRMPSPDRIIGSQAACCGPQMSNKTRPGAIYVRFVTRLEGLGRIVVEPAVSEYSCLFTEQNK